MSHVISRYRPEDPRQTAVSDLSKIIPCQNLLLGIYVAMVPILIEQHDQEFIMLNNVNFTEISLKFLAEMLPDKTCLHEQALELYVYI